MLVLEIFVLYLDVDSRRPEEYCWSQQFNQLYFGIVGKVGTKTHLQHGIFFFLPVFWKAVLFVSQPVIFRIRHEMWRDCQRSLRFDCFVCTCIPQKG